MKVASEGVEGTEPEGERWRERERERCGLRRADICMAACIIS